MIWVDKLINFVFQWRCHHEYLYKLLLFILINYLAIFLIAILRKFVPTLSGVHLVFPETIANDFDPAKYNLWRLKKAQDFMENLDSSRLKINSSADYALTIITAKRSENFLTQVVAAFLEIAVHNSFLPFMQICEVSNRDDEEIRFIAKYIAVVKLEKLLDAESYLGRINKEALDYWACLSSSRNAKYIVLIEDDAIPVPKFFELLDSVKYQMDRNPEIDYVKLYHPGSLRKLPYVFQFFADIRYFVTRSVYLGISESCCTPAVIFRGSKVPLINEYFKTIGNRNEAKDTLLDDSSFISRMSDTNFVDHIGYLSSIRGELISLDELKILISRSEHRFPF